MNVVQPFGCYDVVPHVDFGFLHIGEHLSRQAPREQ